MSVLPIVADNVKEVCQVLQVVRDVDGSVLHMGTDNVEEVHPVL